MQSTLTLSEVFWYLFQKSSNNVQKGEGFCIFQSLYFHDLTFSSREETELVSGKHTPAGLGNPAEHHLPPPPRSVPLGLLTLSPVSPVRVLLAKDRACSSACGHSDAVSQQPTKSNAENGPVLQRFPEL